MNIEGNGSGFKAYAEKEKVIQEDANEKMNIKSLLLELDSYMPPRGEITHLKFPDEINMDEKEGKRNDTAQYLNLYIGKPDRIAWLQNFVSEAKRKMENTLEEISKEITEEERGKLKEKGVNLDMSILTEKYTTTPSGKTKWTDFNTSVREEISQKLRNVGFMLKEEESKKFPTFE